MSKEFLAHHAQILESELNKKFADPNVTEVGVLGSAIVNETKNGQMTIKANLLYQINRPNYEFFKFARNNKK